MPETQHIKKTIKITHCFLFGLGSKKLYLGKLFMNEDFFHKKNPLREYEGGWYFTVNGCYPAPVLNVDLGIFGIALYKFTPWCHLISHQHGKNMIAFCRVFNAYLPQGPGIRVHRCIP